MDSSATQNIPKTLGIEIVYADGNHDSLATEKREKGKPFYTIRCQHFTHSETREELIAHGAFVDVEGIEKSKKS